MYYFSMILFVTYVGNSASVTTLEFESKELCEQALIEIKQQTPDQAFNVRGLCVKSKVK